MGPIVSAGAGEAGSAKMFSARCSPLFKPMATMPKCVTAADADADANADADENDDDTDNTEHQGLQFFYDTRHNQAFCDNSQTTMGQNTPPHAHNAHQCPLAAFTLLRSD